MDVNKASLDMHYELAGKIEVVSRKKIETREDLSLAYTPGVAEPCRVIATQFPLPPGAGFPRRTRRAGPGRHRTRGRHAGDGGQMRAV